MVLNMKNLILLCVLILPLRAYSQNDTSIYFSSLGESINDKQRATYYEVLTRKSENRSELQSFHKDQKKWVEGNTSIISKLSDTSFMIENPLGKSIRFVETHQEKYFIKEYKDNKLVSEGTCKLVFPLIIDGSWKIYSVNTGRIKSDSEFVNNRMISNKFWISSTEYLTDVFSKVDTYPIYGKGDSDLFVYIRDNIQYPAFAKENKITGKVILIFVVMTDGSINGVEVVRAADPYLAAEALRVIESMPARWKPGTIEGKKVNAAMSIPISFDMK